MDTRIEMAATNITHTIAIGNLMLKIGSRLSGGKNAGSLWELYRLAKQIQGLYFWESIKLNPDEGLMHQCLHKLHHLLYSYLPIKDVELSESRVVPVGDIKRQQSSVLTKVYFGWSASNSAPTESVILASDSISMASGLDQYPVPFQREDSFQYLWFAEAVGELTKQHWTDQGNPLNKGEIGGGSNLFASPVVIGGFRFYITNWETIANGNIILSATAL